MGHPVGFSLLCQANAAKILARQDRVKKARSLVTESSVSVGSVGGAKKTEATAVKVNKNKNALVIMFFLVVRGATHKFLAISCRVLEVDKQGRKFVESDVPSYALGASKSPDKLPDDFCSAVEVAIEAVKKALLRLKMSPPAFFNMTNKKKAKFVTREDLSA
jgi:hypothetical protein